MRAADPRTGAEHGEDLRMVSPRVRCAGGPRARRRQGGKARGPGRGAGGRSQQGEPVLAGLDPTRAPRGLRRRGGRRADRDILDAVSRR